MDRGTNKRESVGIMTPVVTNSFGFSAGNVLF